MAQSIDLRYHIRLNTEEPRTYWYATIDGRTYLGKNGKILFRGKGYVKSSMRQSSLYYAVVKPLAENIIGFMPQDDIRRVRRWEFYDQMWNKFLEDRVEFHSIEI